MELGEKKIILELGKCSLIPGKLGLSISFRFEIFSGEVSKNVLLEYLSMEVVNCKSCWYLYL